MLIAVGKLVLDNKARLIDEHFQILVVNTNITELDNDINCSVALKFKKENPKRDKAKRSVFRKFYKIPFHKPQAFLTTEVVVTSNNAKTLCSARMFPDNAKNLSEVLST